MSLTYEAAKQLFKNGDFSQLVNASGNDSEERKSLEPRHRAILAHALALVGQGKAAQHLANIGLRSDSSAAVRSQAELTLAVVDRRHGDHASAVRHSQAATSLAEESDDPELTAWAHLHLFRLLIETSPIDKVFVSLPKVRRVVARAGTNHASAYLHTCVSVLEGQVDRLYEAQRHCDITDSLLELSSNTWLAASSLVNRGCIACLNCELETARTLLLSARTLAMKSGHASSARAADASTGHVQLLTGQFKEAEESLSTVLRDDRADVTSQLGALDGIARVYLALNRLDDTERVLRDLHERVNQYERPEAIYYLRWATITEARLLIRRGALEEAIRRLSVAEELSSEVGDTPLAVTARLVSAHAFSLLGRGVRRQDIYLARVSRTSPESVSSKPSTTTPRHKFWGRSRPLFRSIFATERFVCGQHRASFPFAWKWTTLFPLARPRSMNPNLCPTPHRVMSSASPIRWRLWVILLTGRDCLAPR